MIHDGLEHKWVAGLDLGKSQDYSAFAVLHATRRAPSDGGVTIIPDGAGGKITEVVPPPLFLAESAERTAQQLKWQYRLVYLKRWENLTDYTVISEWLAKMYSRSPDPAQPTKLGLCGTTLAVDHTGVGDPMCDMIVKDMRIGGGKARVVPVHITGGTKTTPRERGGYNVPKKSLVSVMQSLITGGDKKRLTYAERLDNGRALVKELDNFKVKINEATANESFECLVGGTMVETLEGLKPIECVTDRDMVATREGYRRVLWAGETKRVRKLCRATFDHNTLEGTDDHLVWTTNRGWAELGKLTCRDLIIRANTSGRTARLVVPVETIESPSPVPVYDVVVEGCHEFYANGVLAHNSWREHEHDDLVLALAITCWAAENATQQFNMW